MIRFYPRKLQNHGNNLSVSLPKEVVTILDSKGISLKYGQMISLIFDDKLGTLVFDFTAEVEDGGKES